MEQAQNSKIYVIQLASPLVVTANNEQESIINAFHLLKDKISRNEQLAYRMLKDCNTDERDIQEAAADFEARFTRKRDTDVCKKHL